MNKHDRKPWVSKNFWRFENPPFPLQSQQQLRVWVGACVVSTLMLPWPIDNYALTRAPQQWRFRAVFSFHLSFFRLDLNRIARARNAIATFGATTINASTPSITQFAQNALFRCMVSCSLAKISATGAMAIFVLDILSRRNLCMVYQAQFVEKTASQSPTKVVRTLETNSASGMALIILHVWPRSMALLVCIALNQRLHSACTSRKVVWAGSWIAPTLLLDHTLTAAGRSRQVFLNNLAWATIRSRYSAALRPLRSPLRVHIRPWPWFLLLIFFHANLEFSCDVHLSIRV